MNTFSTIEDICLNIIVLLVIVGVLRFLSNLIIKSIFKKYLSQTKTKTTRIKRRLNTLIQVENNIAISVIIIFTIFIILKHFVNITGFVAGAGVTASVIALTISLGAQPIMKDIFTGFFFLLQDQFGVGDIVQIGSASQVIGTITSLTLRTTTVREMSGSVTTFANSSINQIANLSKGWSMVDDTYPIPSNIPIDTIIEVLKIA